MKRVLVYPGTFDPIHSSHLHLLREAMRFGHYDKVIVLLQDNRFKRGEHMFTLEARAKMIRECLDVLGLSSEVEVEVDPNEYIVPGLEAMKFVLYPPEEWQMYLLIGDDVLSSIQKWMFFEWLVDNVRFVIGRRTLGTFEGIQDVADGLGLDVGDILGSHDAACCSTDKRGEIQFGVIADAIKDFA